MIEKAVMKLLREEIFYGNFLLNTKRIYTDKVPTAGVSITDKINLYVNPEFWETLTLKQQTELLKHEAMHVFHGHPIRAKDYGLSKGNFHTWNLACDIAINEPLTSLHELGVTYEKLKNTVPDALPNESSEYYYGLIKENEDKFPSYSCIDDHEVWNEESDVNPEIQKQVVNDAVKKAAERSGGIGNCPYDVQIALNKLNKSTVNWRQELRRFFCRAENSVRSSSRKRRNRRYGILYPGQKKRPKLAIDIVVDESGSVGEQEHTQFFSEISHMQNLYGDNLLLRVIHCDVDINRVYEYKKGMKIERTGCGGTDLMPGIKKADEFRSDGMIIFSDGEIWGDEYTKPNCPVLWAIVRNENMDLPFGSQVYVNVEGN